MSYTYCWNQLDFLFPVTIIILFRNHIKKALTLLALLFMVDTHRNVKWETLWLNFKSYLSSSCLLYTVIEFLTVVSLRMDYQWDSNIPGTLTFSSMHLYTDSVCWKPMERQECFCFFKYKLSADMHGIVTLTCQLMTFLSSLTWKWQYLACLVIATVYLCHKTVKPKKSVDFKSMPSFSI